MSWLQIIWMLCRKSDFTFISLDEKKGLKLIDSPLSCGVKRASEGSLTIMESCADEALEHAGSVLSALSEKLYVIKGGCGAGVHIAYAAEAMALIWSSIGIGYKNLFYRQKMVKEHPD
uniref:Putative NAD(P)-binding domain-containing protein n=1 Tax=Helianthus annuus TaxID=4232 RepID=A0A251UF81_HELAN